ncbi:MAG: helix-turn-helix domain-containing protein [Sarcina sp.]
MSGMEASRVSLSFNDFITHLNVLILEGEKDQILLLIDKVYLSKILDLEALKVLSIRIFVNIDSINEEFNILNKYKREKLTDFISSICKLNKEEQLRELVLEKIDVLIKSKNNFNLYSPIVYRAIKYINENFNKDINIKEFCNMANVNSVYFGRKFTKEVGCTFSYYLNKKRNDVARTMIINTDKKIADISMEVGYLDTSHFYKQFKKYFKISPAKFRET